MAVLEMPTGRLSSFSLGRSAINDSSLPSSTCCSSFVLSCRNLGPPSPSYRRPFPGWPSNKELSRVSRAICALTHLRGLRSSSRTHLLRSHQTHYPGTCKHFTWEDHSTTRHAMHSHGPRPFPPEDAAPGCCTAAAAAGAQQGSGCTGEWC
jgi:hypothetical protein